MSKCIVHGCTNHKHEGVFIGDLCEPCYVMITTGKANPSNNFIQQLQEEIERLREQLKVAQVIADMPLSQAEAELREQLAACQKERDALLKGCKVSVPTIAMEQALMTEYRRGYQAAIEVIKEKS